MAKVVEVRSGRFILPHAMPAPRHINIDRTEAEFLDLASSQTPAHIAAEADAA